MKYHKDTDCEPEVRYLSVTSAFLFSCSSLPDPVPIYFSNEIGRPGLQTQSCDSRLSNTHNMDLKCYNGQEKTIRRFAK
jgi:hypothetical protein